MNRHRQDEDFADEEAPKAQYRGAGGPVKGNGFTPGFDNHQQTIIEEFNDVEFMCDDGKPIQFIRYDKVTGKFMVMPEAVEVSHKNLN